MGGGIRKPALRATERQIQRLIVDYLRLQGWFVLETYLGTKRGGQVFMTKGIPDLYAVKEGRHVWLEVKRPGGRLTRAQKALHEALRAHGAEVYVVRSLEDVQRVIGES